jgi:hypothetical protein
MRWVWRSLLAATVSAFASCDAAEDRYPPCPFDRTIKWPREVIGDEPGIAYWIGWFSLGGKFELVTRTSHTTGLPNLPMVNRQPNPLYPPLIPRVSIKARDFQEACRLARRYEAKDPKLPVYRR